MLRVLEITVPVFGIILVGFLYGRLRPADMSTVNRLNVNLFTPALLFFILSERMEPAPALSAVALGGAVIVIGSGLLAWGIARAVGWSPRTIVPAAMFKNAGNLGLPIMVLAFGEEALPFAVILFVVENTLHFTVGIRLLSGRTDLRQLFGNPMVVAAALGLVCMALDIGAPAIIVPGLEMMANVAIPLMLVALGVRLTDIDLSHWRVGLVGGALAPLTGVLTAVPWLLLTQPGPMVAGLLLIFAVLPPAVLNYILAEHYGQEPERVAPMVALGNAAAVITMPLMLSYVLS
jgi:predicted permease